MKKKVLLKDMVVVWIAVTALLCAAVNMHVSRNMLDNSETPTE